MTEDSANCDEKEPGRSAAVTGGAGSNPFWGCVIAAGFAFAVTCLVHVAAGFGDAQGPMNRWVIQYGTAAILLETALLIGSGLLAMTLDRRITLRHARETQPQTTAPDSMTAESSIG